MDKVEILHPTGVNQEYQLSEVDSFSQKGRFSASTYMYLVKIHRFDLMDVSVYHKKCKAFFKSIKITKSLRCKLKGASLHFRQETDVRVTFVFSVLIFV